MTIISKLYRYFTTSKAMELLIDCRNKMKTYTLTEQAKKLILKSDILNFEEKNMNDQDFFIYACDKLKIVFIN